MRRAAHKAFALQYIKDIRVKDPGIGGVKLWYMYRRDFQGNDLIGRDRFVDIINEYGLKVRLKVRIRYIACSLSICMQLRNPEAYIYSFLPLLNFI